MTDSGHLDQCLFDEVELNGCDAIVQFVINRLQWVLEYDLESLYDRGLSRIGLFGQVILDNRLNVGGLHDTYISQCSLYIASHFRPQYNVGLT